MSKRRPRRLRVRRNPFGIDTSDLLLLGGVAYLTMTDQGKAVFQNLVKATGGIGQDTQVGTGGSGVVLSNPQFRVVRIDAPSFITVGGTVTATIVVSHLGAGGSFGAGVEARGLNLACDLGLHGDPIQAFDNTFTCRDDASWTEYTVSVSGQFQGGSLLQGNGGVGVQWRGYVRDLRGGQMAEAWNCGGAWTL